MQHDYLYGRYPTQLRDWPPSIPMVKFPKDAFTRPAEPSALQAALAQQVSELRDRVRELEGQVAELQAADLGKKMDVQVDVRPYKFNAVTQMWERDENL